MSNRHKISDVFGSQPRVGGQFWWKRNREIENGLLTLFDESTSKKIVIIDGPTGAGKTSLSYRTLYLAKARYNYIAVDEDTTWATFCRKIVSIPKNQNVTEKRKFSFSVKSLMPGGGADTEHTETYDSLKELEFANKYLDQITTDTLVDAIISDDTAIVIDDFEKANSELIRKIANLCKKLSNPSSAGSHSKIIIISCRRSFEDILNTDDTLDGRIHHITLGGLKGPKETWSFLCNGFNLLEIVHPSTSKFPGEKEKISLCAEFAYDATGGVLKNLTELGEILSRKSYRNKSLKADLSIDLSREAAQKNINKYVRNTDGLTKLVSSNEHVEAVVNYLYQNGITRCHSVAEMQGTIESKNDSIYVDAGISSLIDLDFLIPTGVNGSSVFVRKPNYALAYCVARYRFSHYRIVGSMRSTNSQATLPLVVDWEHDENGG